MPEDVREWMVGGLRMIENADNTSQIKWLHWLDLSSHHALPLPLPL